MINSIFYIENTIQIINTNTIIIYYIYKIYPDFFRFHFFEKSFIFYLTNHFRCVILYIHNKTHTENGEAMGHYKEKELFLPCSTTSSSLLWRGKGHFINRSFAFSFSTFLEEENNVVG